MGKADENKVVVSGGSHGGFISLHLVGQHPVSVFAVISLLMDFNSQGLLQSN